MRPTDVPCLLSAVLVSAAALAGPVEEGPPPNEDAPLVLDLATALEIARRQAPALAAARERLGEPRGTLEDAGRFLREDPMISIGAGSRSAPDGDSTDRGIEISQAFEPPSRRRARREAARAGLEAAEASLADHERTLEARVAEVFLRGLHAGRRLEIAGDRLELAEGLAGAAERRYEAGDIGLLEARLARLAVAPARAQGVLWEARLLQAEAELRRFLGLTRELDLRLEGELEAALRDEAAAAVASTRTAPETRADLDALEARVRQAEAEERLARSLATPSWQVWLGYEEEEGAEIVGGGVALSIPLSRPGRGARAAARARAAGFRRELEAGRRDVDIEVESRRRTARALQEALQELETSALDGVEEDAALAERAYEMGALTLGEFLVLRREATEAQVAYADLLLESAMMRAALLAALGEL